MSKAELYYQIALAQYQEQHRRSAGFDARAGSMMAAAATLAGIGAVILNFPGQSPLLLWTCVVTALLAGAFIAATVFAVNGLRPRGWSVSPDPNELAEHLDSSEYAGDDLTEWIGDQLAESVDLNEKALIAKGRSVIITAVCVGAMALLVIALAVVVNLRI